MSQILETNIFFLITGLAVIIVTAGFCVALYFIVRILRDASIIVSKIRKASDELEHDFEELRSQIKTEGVKVRTVVDIAMGFVLNQLQKRRPKRKPKDPTTLQ